MAELALSNSSMDIKKAASKEAAFTRLDRINLDTKSFIYLERLSGQEFPSPAYHRGTT